MKTTEHYHARALIAERHADVERDVLVLGPRKPAWAGSSSILVLVRVVGDREPMWIARERLIGEDAEGGAGAADERPEMTREASPRVPGALA